MTFFVFVQFRHISPEGINEQHTGRVYKTDTGQCQIFVLYSTPWWIQSEQAAFIKLMVINTEVLCLNQRRGGYRANRQRL